MTKVHNLHSQSRAPAAFWAHFIAPARMALLGDLIDTDSSTPIMLERDCVHRDGGPHWMLTVSLDAQLATCNHTHTSAATPGARNAADRRMRA